jgi:hypothetical protein
LSRSASSRYGILIWYSLRCRCRVSPWTGNTNRTMLSVAHFLPRRCRCYSRQPGRAGWSRPVDRCRSLAAHVHMRAAMFRSSGPTAFA